jgi:hypothetical protein
MKELVAVKRMKKRMLIFSVSFLGLSWNSTMTSTKKSDQWHNGTYFSCVRSLDSHWLSSPQTTLILDAGNLIC